MHAKGRLRWNQSCFPQSVAMASRRQCLKQTNSHCQKPIVAVKFSRKIQEEQTRRWPISCDNFHFGLAGQGHVHGCRDDETELHYMMGYGTQRQVIRPAGLRILYICSSSIPYLLLLSASHPCKAGQLHGPKQIPRDEHNNASALSSFMKGFPPRYI